MAKYSLNVNGRAQTVEVDDPQQPLLYVLRNALGLTGAKFGCGLGQCGACTVMADGEAIFSCLMPISTLTGRKIKTVEGLGTIDKPGPMQRAFMEMQAAQCGYCIPGMMMRGQALLEKKPGASEDDIRKLREVCAEAMARHGRPRPDFPLCVYTTVCIENDSAKAESRTRDFLEKYYGGGVNFRGMMGLGPAPVVAEVIQRYQGAGVSDLCIRLVGENQVAQMEKFVREVLPLTSKG